MTFPRAELLAAAERSLTAAGSRDRAGWVGLFTANGQVEDPVGSRPHRGQTEITRFYDTFIGPRDITAHRDVDLVSGRTVVRDLELEVAMAPSVTMRIPVYIRYDLRPVGTELKLDRLRAYWELPAMVRQFARSGLASVPVGLRLTRALLRNQGPGGAVGFLGGLWGPGARARRAFTRFLDDARAGDEVAVRRGLAKGAQITTGDDGVSGAAELLDRLAGCRRRKLIAAGRSLVVGLERNGERAVLFAEVNSRPFTIARVRYFAA
ncbi:ketosteroid isomerase family protein [Micromonospora sp. WMMD736]|uniref:ketosteroid isomerase family protein n=1 Tax=Micromonospora sp. WMMD736 TaxID=3404112 RepID=UPI003B931C7A